MEETSKYHQYQSDEPAKLPEGETASEKPEEKPIAPEVSTPKTQADSGVGADNNPNHGAGDLNKP